MSRSRREFVSFLACLGLGACGQGREGPATQPRPEASPAPPPPAPVIESSPSAASDPGPRQAPDLEAHVAMLQERFGPRGWTVLAQRPFAVVGDGTPEQVAKRSEGTIRWAVERLEAAYFEAPPADPITIYLFETAASYEAHALELFGEAPDTPYGYYSPADRALVMNIGTGGGTLVHEIVHPYMAANFPACPSWFDEGLASLYEQSSERDGKIIGLTNWRLAGLQDALRSGTVPSFEDLCASGRGFYTADPGTNYAQARYLCYWLQEHGVLGAFYRSFRAKVDGDPTGYSTLLSYIGTDIVSFRRAWEQYVLGLRF